MERSKSSKSDLPMRRRFAAAPVDVGAGGVHIECTGASCRSFTAVLVADCIALGCCPCAVVNMLALALVKVPWVVSRRCLGKLRRKGVALRRRRVRDEGGGGVEKTTREAKSSEKRKEWGEVLGILGTKDGENGQGSSPKLESDKVWMELYQIGQWGFGRLSFSGVQGRGN